MGSGRLSGEVGLIVSNSIASTVAISSPEPWFPGEHEQWRELSRSALAGPGRDLGSEPELAATHAHVDHGPGHVGVTPLVAADTVELREAQDLGDSVRVDQVFDIDTAPHTQRL